MNITRRGRYTNIQYACFADDMVILIDAERRSDWLVKAVNRRLREEFVKLGEVDPIVWTKFCLSLDGAAG